MVLFTMVSAIMLAGCHGSNVAVASSTPPKGSFTYATTSASTPLSITFTGTGSATADSNPVTFTWSFGDQTVSGSTQATTGTPVTHVYAEPGTYDVTLTITDDHGSSINSIQTLVITPSAGTGLGVENWSWLGGSKYANSVGTYETQFTADAKNLPSARQYAATWYSGGKLWMFGGAGYDSAGNVGALSDLWYCTPPSTTKGTGTGGNASLRAGAPGNPLGNCVWTWVAGSNMSGASGIYPASAGTFSAVSIPGARSAAATWTDLNGNLWLFGGAGYDSKGANGELNDMWSFSASGQSEWVSGANVINDQGNATTPSARAYATAWTDHDGNFWLFGGQGVNSAGTTIYLNDLWCFTPAYQGKKACATGATGAAPTAQAGTPITSGTWTLVAAGTSAGNGAGVYGTKGQTASTNIPGGRINAQHWVDGSGNLWMFGGSGYDASGTFGSLNDVWKFSPATATVGKTNWTFESGANAVGATESTGTKGQGSTANYPSARLGTIGWVDSTGTILWMFGGSGSDSTATTATSDGGGALNELWAYNTLNNEWAFMAATNITISASGSTSPASGGVAGSAGIYQPLGTIYTWGIPGSRLWSNVWVDSSNNVWIFGGTGDDAIGTSGYLNDLWLMQPTSAPAW
ncbi:MAG TPA: PKD domain-containing protein [Burkholderiaceae bacterium]